MQVSTVSTGSTWVECDKTNQAECPFCGLKGWFIGFKWGGCKHAVGPGHMGKSIDTPPAMIYNLDPESARRLYQSQIVRTLEK